MGACVVAVGGEEKEKAEEQVDEAEGDEQSSEAERLRLRTMVMM